MCCTAWPGFDWNFCRQTDVDRIKRWRLGIRARHISASNGILFLFYLCARVCVCVRSLLSFFTWFLILHLFFSFPSFYRNTLAPSFVLVFFKPRHQNETSHSDWPIGKGGCRRCLFYKRAFKGNPVKKTNQKNSVSRLFNPSLTFPRLVSVFFSARRSLTRLN